MLWWYGAGADRVKVVEWGSGFLMSIGLDGRVLFKYIFNIIIIIIKIYNFVSQSVMDLYYSPVGAGNATYWRPTSIKPQRRTLWAAKYTGSQNVTILPVKGKRTKALVLACGFHNGDVYDRNVMLLIKYSLCAVTEPGWNVPFNSMLWINIEKWIHEVKWLSVFIV